MNEILVDVASSEINELIFLVGMFHLNDKDNIPNVTYMYFPTIDVF